MNDLNRRAWGGLAFFAIAMAAMIFVAAWTLDYWQAWVYLAVFFGIVSAITVYLMRNDPALLERRVNAGPAAEQQTTQRSIQTLASVTFIALYIVSGLDRRLGWSTVPTLIALGGDALVATGLYGVFRVFRENTFTSGTIELAADQRVITTGPYAIVRHPMYATALLMVFGTAIALASWWALIPAAAMALAMVWRLLDEEKFLATGLPGYGAYRRATRYRLVPFIW